MKDAFTINADKVESYILAKAWEQHPPISSQEALSNLHLMKEFYKALQDDYAKALDMIVSPKE